MPPPKWDSIDRLSMITWGFNMTKRHFCGENAVLNVGENAY
ncbi:hypothetical protein BH11BAC7_BH11BAC7_15990 [soil metagenome]